MVGAEATNLTATEALTRREASTADISAVHITVTWRYPTAMALVTDPEALNGLLEPMARTHPGPANWLIAEAQVVSGYRARNEPSAAEDGSKAPPAESASKAGTPEVGGIIRKTVEAWLDGLCELRELMPFAAPDGSLRPLGVSLSPEGSVEICWAPADQGHPDIFCMYPPYAPAEFDPAVLATGRQGWGPYQWSSKVAHSESWHWRWTHDLVSARLTNLIDRRALPARAGSLLAAERDWHLACSLLKRGRTIHLPIDPTSVIGAVAIAVARAEGDLTVVRFSNGAVSTHGELYRLASRCELLAGDGTQLHRPVPAPDKPKGQGWVWGAYSPERLRELTEAVWREALLAYGQLVADHFPRIGRTLGIAALGRPKVEGTLVFSRHLPRIGPYAGQSAATLRHTVD